MTAPLLALTDFSDSARAAGERAARLAADTGRPLLLLHVLDLTTLAAVDALLPEGAGIATGMVREAAVTALTREADRLRLALGADARPELVEGPLLASLLAAIRTHAPGLVVVGAQGQSALRPFLLGSTAERLLRKTTTPVLVVKQPADHPYTRVLVPVDFSVDAGAALTTAREWLPQTHLSVLHVFDPDFSASLMVDWPDTAALERYRHQLRQEASAQLQGFITAEFGREANASALLRSGPVARNLTEAVTDLGVELVVMGSHGRGFLERVLLGSITRHALTQCGADVLVVPHPD